MVIELMTSTLRVKRATHCVQIERSIVFMNELLYLCFRCCLFVLSKDVLHTRIP